MAWIKKTARLLGLWCVIYNCVMIGVTFQAYMSDKLGDLNRSTQRLFFERKEGVVAIWATGIIGPEQTYIISILMTAFGAKVAIDLRGCWVTNLHRKESNNFKMIH